MSDKTLAMHWVLGLANTLPKFGGTIIISHQCTPHVEHPPNLPSHPTMPPFAHTQKVHTFCRESKRKYLLLQSHAHKHKTLMTKHDLVRRLLSSYDSHQHSTLIYTFPNPTQPNHHVWTFSFMLWNSQRRFASMFDV